MSKQDLALFGGPKAIQMDPKNDPARIIWPMTTKEDEEAVLDVLRRGAMSGTDVTKQFEAEYAAWQGTKYALAHNNGTAAIEAAMYGCGVRRGDEVICPSVTYWASCLCAYNLGATVVFCGIEPKSMCADPKDIEKRITSRTKAIVVVHYLGHPADMDPIMAVARKHNIKVIEDVSHAHGGLYKGRKVGSIGDVGAMSLMSGKSFAIGEAGILTTDNREIYERAIAWGHYERFGNPETIETPDLKPLVGLPLGGHKYRLHQMSAAVGRVQLKYYDERTAEIRDAMNYFWDQLKGAPGLHAHRTDPKDTSMTMGGWYAAHGLYAPEELGGLSVTRFCQAVAAEGYNCSPGVNKPLHLHPLFNTADVYGDGKPTRIAWATRDLRQPAGSLPMSESIMSRSYSIPWFKKFQKDAIDQYVLAFRKVAENAAALREQDQGNPAQLGGWHFFSQR